MKRRIPVLFILALSIAVFTFFSLSTEPKARATSSGESRQQWQLSPAGRLMIDAATGRPAVMPMTMGFVRTPDRNGPNGMGRYLIAVNSGYGLTFSSDSKPQQTLSVIDLNAKPDPVVIQNVYFPAPQSANVGLVFDQKILPDGKYRFFVSGGFENKIWVFWFDPQATQPIIPGNAPDKQVTAPFIEVTAFSGAASSPNYNDNRAPVYPTGLALASDGQTLYVANNLGDTLGIVSDVRGDRNVTRIDLHPKDSKQFLYPYDVKIIERGSSTEKIYVSLWGDGTIAVVDPKNGYSVKHIPVKRHPTAMMMNRTKTRLYVVNSNSDAVSVIDTASDTVVESIDVRLSETAESGSSPEGLALSEDEKTLYVANTRADAIAVVRLDDRAGGERRSRAVGFIPTGLYASAVAIVGNRLFVANGKGTGMENSSLVVNQTGLFPNVPNVAFPGKSYNRRGIYSAAIVSGNISMIDVPSERELFDYSQTVLKTNGLIGREKRNIFADGRSPFKHVIYIIRENRSYDQVLGDLPAAGNGQKADGEPSVAIFGSGDAAISPKGAPQSITPNARAIALRFGLLDRFFVNAEASPDGHNWSTAAFSNDYVDKAFRWDYSRRGRTYDYEGFNRLPSYWEVANQPSVALPPVFDLPATGEVVANYLRRFVPYLNGGRDIAEPESLYLWDAAKRAGLTYRNYGEFIATVSADDVLEVNTQKPKKYPDISPTIAAFAAKQSLEGHFSSRHRNFDQNTPDILTTDSYQAASEAKGAIDGAITPDNPDPRFRGSSRFGEWAREFRSFVKDRKEGKGDNLPNLSIVRLPNDHTAGLKKGMPTPQFYVAENDYALGRLVEEVSKSPYWEDTAVFVVEDDAQDGPDHVDAHRSPGFVISAYNRPGALIHEYHNTVSLIRTLEMCLGISPMNFLDAHATPIDIFTNRADLSPFTAQMPVVALNSLFPPENPSRTMARYMKLTETQDLTHPDMADPRKLNEIIWFSVKGDAEMPGVARLPAFDLMISGIKPDNGSAEDDD